MAAICVGHIHVKNADAWEAYRSQVGATISQYGGQLLFRGQQQGVFSGKMPQENVVALQFESLEAAHRWHDSPEYQALLPIREQAADVTLVLYQC